MKKIIALIMAAVIAAAAFTQPIYAAEEPVSAAVEYTVRPLGVTPRLRGPVVPQVSRIRIRPQIDLSRVDFSKYIPKVG